jgi:putative mRNA 3-end processing factor
MATPTTPGPDTASVAATPETLAIMAERYGEDFAVQRQPMAYGQSFTHNGVEVGLVPAGHVLGSAQAVIRWKGMTIVVSGDYKRRRDPTCPAFEPVPCDVFVTEATFGLPVFRHPDDRGEVAALLKSVEQFPERSHIVGAYALGKAQRVIKLLREAGWDKTIHVHGAMDRLNRLYERHGVDLGRWRRPRPGPRRTSRARSSSPRPRPWPTAGRGAFPTRSTASPAAGCGCGREPASGAWNCR